MTWDYENIDEAIREIDTITYNWNFISICFELWERDIIEERQNNINIEETHLSKQKVSLKEITGTGENYIRELCAGRKKGVSRTFNSSDDRLISYLRGQQGFDAILVLKRFIVLNNANNYLVSLKKRKQPCSEITNWIEDNRNHKIVDIKEEIKKLKEKTKHTILQMRLKDDSGLTALGRLRDYLLGKNNVEVAYSELQRKLVQLSVAVYELPCDVIEKFSDNEFDTAYTFAEMLFHRINAVKQYRLAKDKENKLRRDIYTKQSLKEAEERRNKEREEDKMLDDMAK